MSATNRTAAIVLAALAAAGIAMLGGCDDKGPAERAGEQIDESVEDAGEAMQDAGEAVEDAVEE